MPATDKNGKSSVTIIKTQDTVYLKEITAPQGYVVNAKLPIGRYTLREEQAPKGYLLTSDVTFEVKDTGEIQKVVMKDDTAKGKVILNKTEGRLGYNSYNKRYGLLSSDLWIDPGFHCGECLEVLVDAQWVKTRMEMNLAREWYLVGTPYCGDLEYVRARIPE